MIHWVSSNKQALYYEASPMAAHGNSTSIRYLKWIYFLAAAPSEA